ncbi:MAG: ABC transporter ATP-binding protein, partial [Actinomycetota bacterium]
MSSVTFTGVTKRYGSVTAVEDLTLDIADGEFMVLLGPSGCGKSTALRMIAGLEEVTVGELRIGDRVVNDVVPAKRDVSMVFQSYALYPHMSVAKNIESPLVTRATRVPGTDGRPDEVRKLTGAERKERIAEAARMLGLEDYLDRKPGELSGGQR